MEEERRRQVEAVVQAARVLPAVEQAEFLDQACGGDPALRQEVESLLRAATDTRFSESPAEAPHTGSTQTSAPRGGRELLDRLQRALGSAYRVERELGGGGMARIFVATDTALGRRVVVKVLAPELAAGLDTKRFHREVRLAASLQHSHVVPLHTAGEADGLLYYTMPFVAGESLGHRLERDGPLPVGEAVRLLREVTDALGFAHRRGIIHRDLKPANILLEEGHALVADFGIAKAVVAASTDTTTGMTHDTGTLTSTGLVLGTPVYMAPEQAANDESMDHRADLYALGCLAYEVLTGRPPFQASSVRGLITAHMIEPPTPVAVHRPEVPPALASLVMGLLAKDPAQRPQTADEVLGALQALERPSTVGRPGGLRAALVVGALFMASSAAVLAVVRYLTVALGLPDWVMPGAVLLLAIGLPIILTTAVVQPGFWPKTAAPMPSRVSRVASWLTWRRALMGGGIAFMGLGLATAGYLTLRALGIGPAGTLLAAGTLKERERILLADFENHTRDSLLGAAVTDAFRTDFSQSPVVTLVPPAQVVEALARMKQPATVSLTPALAREVALRDGIKAVVTGAIAAVANGYLLSAQLVSSSSGEVLAAYRETAADSALVIRAIDRLSSRLRERIGESLKSLRGEPPLERVTTASLAALRQYTLAVRAGDHEGDYEKGIALLKGAIALDSGFAMAYRTLGMYAANLGQLDLIIRGYSAAIERRDRLTERERYFTLGDYHLIVTSEPTKAAAAYEALLERYPEEREALNNLALLYVSLGQRQKAAFLLQRAIAIDSLYMPAHVNLILLQIAMKQWPEAQATYERATRQLPNVGRIWAVGIWLAEQRGDYATAQARARGLDKQFGADPNWRGFARRELATLAAVHGKVRDAERYLREAMAARAEASRPDDYLADAILLASVIAAVAGEPGRGIREVQRALTRYPLDSLRPMDRPYFGLADVNALAARADRARVLMTEYESAVEPLYRRRAKADVNTTWGRIALAERRWQDAIASFREAASGGSPSPLIMPDLGRAYDLAGEADSAIALYERYLATPDAERSTIDATELGRVNRRLGELYEQRGDLGKAADSYSQFIELWKDCDPDLRPQVAEVRRRLAELAKEASG